MIETGPGFFWNRGLGLGLDNNNLTLVSVESGACAMTRLWLWLAALGTKMYQGLPALKYCLIIRAVSPWSKKVALGPKMYIGNAALGTKMYVGVCM